jgi:hypothetical protein
LLPSATLFAILVCSLVVATAALWTTLAPWIGSLRAMPAALAFVAAGALCVAAWWRAQPRAIEFAADGIRAFDRNGACIASGLVTGCVQWGASLLVLSVGATPQRRVLFVAADAVAAGSFREIAVLGRCAKGG